MPRFKPQRLVMAAFLAFSIPGHAHDLITLYQQAKAHDARFAASLAQREAGQEKAVQARAGLLPNLTAQGSTQWNRMDSSTGMDRGYNTHGWTVQLSQPLFRWQNVVQARQGKIGTVLADLELAIARQSLLLRVSEAYFNVLHAQESLDAIEQLLAASQAQLALAKASFEVGTVTITDVHEAQSRFDLATAQKLAGENALELARQNMAHVAGALPAGPLASLPPKASLPPPEPADPQAWIEQARAQGYGVQVQQLLREMARAEVERSRALHFPTVDLVATRAYNGTGFNAQGLPSQIHSHGIGVQVSIPLFQGGATQSRLREAHALETKSEADEEEALRSAGLTAHQAYLGVSHGLAHIHALEAAERSSLSALEANQLGYEVGVRINMDVLNAQSQLADTRQKLSRARYDTLLNQLRLKAAAGLLDEAALEAVDALLQTPSDRQNTPS
jgi:outer membrane protein